jgi:hypothetical protein
LISVLVCSFEALFVHLRNPLVVKTTKRSLHRIHVLTYHRHGPAHGQTAFRSVNTRVFLASFMIAFRPSHVFASMGALEDALHAAALSLVGSFERISGALQQHASFAATPREVTAEFQGLLFDYLRCFKAWKVPDQARLTGRIERALAALYEAQAVVPPGDRIRSELQAQIDRLRGKLEQIAGADALDAFDARPRGDGSGHTPPRLDTEQIAHELLLDPQFQLAPYEPSDADSPVFSRVRAEFHRAFWDGVTADLRRTPPCYAGVLRVMAEVREGMLEVAADTPAATIEAAIDLDSIATRVVLGALPWSDVRDLVGGIVSLMRSMQEPPRANETMALWHTLGARILEAPPQEQPSVLSATLEFLVNRANTMRIDTANARLRRIAPIIRDHGVDYERGKFSEKLLAGGLTLDRTTAWIKRALQRAPGADLLPDVIAGKPDAFVRVLDAAMLSLIVDPEPLTGDTVPETLLLDTQRLALIRRDFDRAINGSTTLVHATQLILDGAPAPNPVQRKAIEDLTKLIVDGDICDLASIDLLLDDAALLTSPPQRLNLHNTLASALQPHDAVRMLM